MRTFTQEQQAEEETRLVTYLIERVVGRASGRFEDDCLFDKPRDKYFIGNLRSSAADEDQQETSLQRELKSKMAPVAFGVDFLLNPSIESATINVTLEWACYYRVFPTFNEQRQLLQRDISTREQDSNSNQNVTNDAASEGDDTEPQSQETEQSEARAERQQMTQNQQRDELCLKFRKIYCQAQGLVEIERPTGKEISVNIDNLTNLCATEMARARQIALNDPECIKTDTDGQDRIRIPDEALRSPERFQAELNNLTNLVSPEWSWQLTAELKSGLSTQGDVLTFIFENSSSSPDRSFNVENYLFDTTARFEFDTQIVAPFEFELAPQGFRYDRELWAKGFNCTVERPDITSITSYQTTHAPIHIQQRYATQTTPEARFDELAKDPLPVLQNILDAMRSYCDEWSITEKQFQTQFGTDWHQFQPEFMQDRQQFEDEIRRFERGLQLIESNPDILFAFCLTNETFARTGSHPTDNTKSKTSWRLFQIVFFITQISGIAALSSKDADGLADREMVDIIYFPTGGGKTEAYLSVLVFHCFFDRIRGKSAGVTAWLRFPLRLLTLQQTQRMADVIGMAELVRLEQTDSRLKDQVAGFGVGYFVGASSSPNKLTSSPYSAEDKVTWSKANDNRERNRWKRVVTCPSCRTSTIQLDLDTDNVRVLHRCTNGSCAFPKGRVPIYVIDNEIYRYLPSVIVGTVDKLAGLGNQRKFSMLLGKITGICKEHGYYTGKCSQDECKDTKLLQPGRIPVGLSGPTLFIQDELHLLREGLGTFDSHYETFTQELLNRFGQNEALKIIASSATIEAFERQVEHLYGRERQHARIFPGIGPSLRESFYAETRNYAQRLFVGVIPHNKTIFNSILEILEYYHVEIQSLAQLAQPEANPYGGTLQPGSDSWKNLIDLYFTSLTYFLATRELSSIRTDIESHVNSNLKSDGHSELVVAELTGSTTTGDVARILESVERPYQINDPSTVLATSMVSHGVDIDRFNAMIFYGMPRQNAEYIQASSRVGRSHVGVVFDCLHPIRERDQSHYSYFTKFHEFLGQLVEPVAINRWSKFSAERTLPGLFMGVLLQLLANDSSERNPNMFYMLDFIKQKISTGQITVDQFVPILQQAYRVSTPSTPAESHFSEEIDSHIKSFLDQIIGASSQAKFVSNAIYPPPMRSLRDVDEAVEIELDDAGSRWASYSQ